MINSLPSVHSLQESRLGVYLRDKLAHFHLDDGVLQLDFQKQRLGLASLAGLVLGVWGEYAQHPHVAAHHHLVCREETQPYNSTAASLHAST